MSLIQLGNRSPSSMVVLSNVSYVHAWEIEKTFDPDLWVILSAENWHLSIYISVAYLVIIFALQAWMKDKERFVLRKSLFMWNCSLAIFSMLGVVRLGPELLHVFAYEWNRTGSVLSPLCSRMATTQVSVFWAFLFTQSKVVELGDTFFIVLRKQPLILLHWYHHVTVLIFTWYTGSFFESPTRTFGFMNYIVHSFMYTYYAVKTVHSGIPRIISKFITLLELLQMVIGVLTALYSFFNNEQCPVRPQHLYWAFGIYASYFVLFANYFIKSYGVFLPKGKKKIV